MGPRSQDNMSKACRWDVSMCELCGIGAAIQDLQVHGARAGRLPSPFNSSALELEELLQITAALLAILCSSSRPTTTRSGWRGTCGPSAPRHTTPGAPLYVDDCSDDNTLDLARAEATAHGLDVPLHFPAHGGAAIRPTPYLAYNRLLQR